VVRCEFIEVNVHCVQKERERDDDSFECIFIPAQLVRQHLLTRLGSIHRVDVSVVGDGWGSGALVLVVVGHVR